MLFKKQNSHKIILAFIGLLVLALGIVLFLIPPSMFTDAAQGFHVLASMKQGGGFNNLVAPDQGDISQNYTQFLTWWAPGQYLVPYFFQLIAGLNLAHGIVFTTLVAEICGLAGWYCFFKKIGFTSIIASVSLLFIVCQVIFMIPNVYYPGGEILIFSFGGWFLYGCIAFERVGIKLVIFVLLSGFLGFFLKSSFLWMYGAGLFCLWFRLTGKFNLGNATKKALWIGIPAVIAAAVIYLTFISKGESPMTNGQGLKLTVATFGFPLASPLLAGFSVDDFFNGLMDHYGKVLMSESWSMAVLAVVAILSVILILQIIRKVPNSNYRLFIIVFYAAATLFFGMTYLLQLDISMESRHFRIIGLLITPGVIYLAANAGRTYKTAFGLIFVGIAFYSFSYIVRGFKVNSAAARGITGIAQTDIDQVALNKVMQLDKEKRNITFVFIGDDVGQEVTHNRFISLPPISDSLKINTGDYEYDGFGDPLYIVLPEYYNGPREKMIMKSFTGYAGWTESMIDDNYVLYVADRKRVINKPH